MARLDTESGRRDWEARIRREVTSWPGVTTRPEQYGGLEFCVGRRALGHVHGGWQADIPFPRALRDRLVAEGRTHPHHIHPDSTWTTLPIETDADAQMAIDLLRLNYDRVMRRRNDTPSA